MDIIYQATSINKKIVDKKPETFPKLYANILEHKTKIKKVSKYCKQTKFYKEQKIKSRIKNEDFYNQIKKTCRSKPQLICSLYLHLNSEFNILKNKSKDEKLKSMFVSIAYIYPLLEKAFKEKF